MSGADLRRARLADAAELARLARELGYPTEVRGWVHVECRFSLEVGDRAEPMGLSAGVSAATTRALVALDAKAPS